MPPRHGQRKVLTKRKRSKSAPPVLQSPKQVKRKQYTNLQIEKALEAVRSGKTSINQVALNHGVPRTTLKGRISGKVKHNTNSGPPRYLRK